MEMHTQDGGSYVGIMQRRVFTSLSRAIIIRSPKDPQIEGCKSHKVLNYLGRLQNQRTDRTRYSQSYPAPFFEQSIDENAPPNAETIMLNSGRLSPYLERYEPPSL
jgi:hypothetical protein